MAYRYGNRRQMEFLPPSVEEYVSENDPVRAYDAFADALDFEELGIEWDEHKVGNSTYDPKAMLKLLVYGYSYGYRSSRKLERAVHHNVSFMWLMGNLKPDHKTIANFRKNNKSALKKVLQQCARLCVKLDLIEGNTLFVDSSKIRANASIKNTWTEDKCKRYLKHIDAHIESILAECEAVDEREEDQNSLVEMKEELKDKEYLRAEVNKIVHQLKEENRQFINTTDPDCTRIKSLSGSHAGFNAQIVVDEKQGLIVSSDVVSENNDSNQFARQVKSANETLGDNCEIACADSGYAHTEELQKVDAQGIKVVVPSQRQASERESQPFDKEQFQYDRQKDCYICPEGQKLTYSHFDQRKKHKVYKIPNKFLCHNCRQFGVCTTSKEGRKVIRLINEEIREKLEVQYEQPESQAIYQLRKQKVELPFGHIKRNLAVGAFLLRGLEGVKAEMSLLASCFNLARMITILGVAGLIQQLKG
jgi:transposase